MHKKVVILLANGFEEIEAITVIDVLRRGGIEVVIAGVDGDMLIGAHDLCVKSDTLLSSIKADDFDMVVLPGGYKGTMKLAEDGGVQELIKSFDSQNKTISAICAAPIALDRAGVLKEKYTCYPSCQDGITSSEFVEDAIVESGNIITSRGPATAMCFALYLVRKMSGEEVYQSVKTALLAAHC